jgi:hypothetical protein
MKRHTRGNGTSREGESEDEDADYSAFLEEPLVEFIERLDETRGRNSHSAQVAPRLEKRQVANTSTNRRKKRAPYNGASEERCVEEKGGADDDDKADGFYQEALDDFFLAGSRDATITWDNLHKAQRQRIVEFCKDRELVVTEWPHRRAALGSVVVSWAESPRKKRGDVAGQNRKR